MHPLTVHKVQCSPELLTVHEQRALDPLQAAVVCSSNMQECMAVWRTKRIDLCVGIVWVHVLSHQA